MKILVDIGHPAHVYFFLHPIRAWIEKGHTVLITARKKEIATDLLESFELPHRVISSHPGRGGLILLFKEMIQRDMALFRFVQKEKPHVMVAIGGVNIAHVGVLMRTPTIVFYDTENAVLSNLITYPFASLVVVPRCYSAWLPSSHLKYPGYHELSYLHPKRFRPSWEKAIRSGLSLDEDTFVVRTVAWQASHDVTERGWGRGLTARVIEYLAERGRVIVSSESPLPPELCRYKFTGPAHHLHHVMAFARLYVGESATMASECAVLGTPAIYAALTGRGYTEEQERSYGLVKNVPRLDWSVIKRAIDEMLSRERDFFQAKREALLRDKIDVAGFVVDLIESYPSVESFRWI